MRTKYALLALLSTLVVVFLVRNQTHPPEVDVGTPSSSFTLEGRPPSLEAVPATSSPTSEPQTADSDRRRVPVEARSRASSNVEASRCLILGRVTDDRGTPLEGFLVTLDPDGGNWTSENRLPRIKVNGRSRRVFAQASDSSGRFSFDAPVTSAKQISFEIEGDDFHAKYTRIYGSEAGQDHSEFLPGRNDLGDITLPRLGVIEGSVHGPSEHAIVHATVALWGTNATGIDLSTRTGAGGDYRLARVPPGSWRVTVEAEGWLTAQSRLLEIRGGEVTSDIDLELQKAPTIAGVVVDDAGYPVPGIELAMFPGSGGGDVQARSAADGSFTMVLASSEPHYFDFAAEGFEPCVGLESPRILAGTTDVRLVLRRSSSITLRILDAETSEPIVRYGAELQVVAGPHGWVTDESSSKVRIQDHPTGDCTLPCPEGKVIARIEAPGHAPAAPELPQGIPPGTVHTISLEREAILDGRLLRNREPQGRVRVVLERAVLDTGSSKTNERPFAQAGDYDLSPFVGRTREWTTQPDGRFRFRDLAAGTYSLTCRDPDGIYLARREIRIAKAGQVDLGDLPLEAGASIRGRLVAPPGLSLEGWKLLLHGPGAYDDLDIASDGCFSFDGLVPGRHVLSAMPRYELAYRPLRTIELGVGEARNVEIDVSDHYPGIVFARVTHSGLPLEGVTVMCRCTEPGMPHGGIGTRTDSEGRIRANLQPCTALGLDVISTADLVIGRASAPCVVASGATTEVEIAVTAGEVQIVFPADFSIPVMGQAQVELRSGSSRTEEVRFTVFHTLDAPGGGLGPDWTGLEVQLGLVEAGEYEATVEVAKWGDRDVGTENRFELQRVATLLGHVQVVDGAKAVLRLEPARR